MSEALTGSCLCGAVNYTATSEPTMIGDCYCVDCRKTSGTSHCTHAVVPDSAFSLTGEIQSYDRSADSGNIVTRAFCPTCGSAIYSRNSGLPGMVFIRASSLDDPNRIEPQMSVYASRAPAWAAPNADKPIFALMPEGGPAAALAGR